jgi:hypothetical protein
LVLQLRTVSVLDQAQVRSLDMSMRQAVDDQAQEAQLALWHTPDRVGTPEKLEVTWIPGIGSLNRR